jgi:hypothetical protein
MSQKNEHKTKRDLTGYARKAEEHWREYRPKLYQYLKKKGTLYDELYEAGRQAEDYMMKAQENPNFKLATDYHAAEEVALRTWIYLPDVDDETDEPERVISD